MAYLDWAATAPPLAGVLEKTAAELKEFWGNPSSIHSPGRAAHGLISRARETLASLVGCEVDEFFFTSGATESNNIVLSSIMKRVWGMDKKRINKNIIISGIEHPSVYDPALTLKRMGFEVRVARSGPGGFVEPGKIESLLDSGTLLVMVMQVNNETGAVQPIREIGESVRRFSTEKGRRVLFHSDGVQGFGKIPLEFKTLPVDTLSLSAHKIGGPKGVGGLVVRKGTPLDPLFKGGAQERGIRPGTENIFGILGFARAAEETFSLREDKEQKIRRLMEYLIQGLSKIRGIRLLPGERGENDHARYSPYILKIACPPFPSEVLVRVLDDHKVIVSSGSACSSGDREKQMRVMDHMGIPRELAESSIRVSIGPATREEDLEALLRVLKDLPGLLGSGNS